MAYTVLFSGTDHGGSPGRKRHFGGTPSELLAGKRAVIVEDEGITQLHLRSILTRAGIHVVGAATSGPEGVATVLETGPDLVLLDIRMPGGYDGLEAARRILAERSICIIMLTAFNEESYREEAQRIGARGYIVKPIDRDTLIPQLEAGYRGWQPQ